MRTHGFCRRSSLAYGRRLLVVLGFALIASRAWGADLPNKADRNAQGATAEVPSEDIFGFTAPTDVGNPGDLNFANENDGRLGKRGGGYRALNGKFEFSKTLSDDLWLAGSFFGAFYRVRDVSGLNDVSQTAFDGLSFEVERRVLRRSAGNPLAISLSVEPRWSRIDGVTGEISNSLSTAFKLFADAVVVPDKLFWGANLEWAPQRAQDPMAHGRWIDSSSTFASMALAVALSPQVYIGVETRYLSAFDGLWLNRNLGNALYVGPTFLWRITEKISINATFQPQVWGRASASPGLNLDLDNFERAQFRAKLAVAL
ncbi:MAG TPA: hypothetical protein VEH75_02985 [Xanthobacteraceae bacterium]|nr:hypothetical protein [Xanthobacteraceae bacterium]